MAEKKAVVSDQGVLATVETNTGEVARFSDGTSVLRQQPETNKDNPNPYFKGIHLGNLQAEVFKDVFQVGLTVFQVMIRLSDPEAGNASDGQLKFSLPANAKQDRTNFKFTATAKDFEKLPGLSGTIGELAGAAENIVLTFPETKRDEVSKTLKENIRPGDAVELIEHSDGNLWLRHSKQQR